ncbi:MAG: phytanoyl-CoA dioxygenase family protein [Lentisphaeria bacterium]|nr:phytanoyl-CoA dioxygenase family protein [Lentisphaeria bacterium]NQZ67381.1 phytanoyl-CoA dioxygenase family protein [Lentisphaeria bacterium]
MNNLASIKTADLLTDNDVAKFICNGYHLIELDLPEGLNETIADKLDQLDHNPGDAILSEIEELQDVVNSTQTQGAMISLLGLDYQLNGHRHWHCKPPHSPYMNWHQDGRNRRNKSIDRCLGLYYPRDIRPDMGPTVIVPGTHFRNCPTDRMSHYTNIRGQVPITVKAGTLAITHYDLWHGTAANTSDVSRHMIKFLFNRQSPNTAATWNHNPDHEAPLDWNPGNKLQTVDQISTFDNPLSCSQSDHYKERSIRQKCWEELLGNP